MTSIQTFTYGKEEGGITTSWDKLKDYRRKLMNANAGMSDTYPSEALLLVLIRSLPSSYSSTVDILNIQRTLSVDHKLKFLEEKETDSMKRLMNMVTQPFAPENTYHLTNAQVLDHQMMRVINALVNASIQGSIWQGIIHISN
jgi:hypothetical protein